MGFIMAFSYIECFWPYIGTSPVPAPHSPWHSSSPPLPFLLRKGILRPCALQWWGVGFLSHHCISWPLHSTSSVLHLWSYGICDSLVHNTSLCCFERHRKNAWAQGTTLSLRVNNVPLSQESVPPEQDHGQRLLLFHVFPCGNTWKCSRSFGSCPLELVETFASRECRKRILFSIQWGVLCCCMQKQFVWTYCLHCSHHSGKVSCVGRASHSPRGKSRHWAQTLV